MEQFQQILPFIAIFIVFYFFMLAPQRKRQKQEKKFAAELKKGDKIVTKSGLHGKIVELSEKDDSCVIETMAGKLKYERSALSMEMSSKLNAPAVIEKK